MKKSVLFASLLALAGLSSAASAADTTGWYVRGDIGSTKVSLHGFGHDTNTGGGVGVGYWFNQNFAVEGSYMDLGSHQGLNSDAWGLGLVAKTHFDQANTGFYVDGRVGIDRVHTSVKVLGVHFSDNSTKGYVGLGVGYDFDQNFGLSLNYRYNNGSFLGTSAHADTFSIGGEYRF